MTSPTFLGLMRQRFTNKNNPIDPVPWELDDKDLAYKHVIAAGYQVPRYAKTSTAAEALEAGESFGDRFVVKQPNRHSTKGVYVLEKLGDGKYLELLSLRVVTEADLKTDGPEPDYWLAEECLDSGIEGKPLPFDYKIYAFRGKVTHVNQIDRNVSPPRATLFDGAFIPLELGKDFSLDTKRWLPEHHVIPRHAGAMLQMAATLSLGLDTRFVKVDCYDGPDGPVFGEFTFASGGDDTGMIRYSDAILGKLDQAMNGVDVGALSGFDIDMKKFRLSLDGRPTISAHPAVYSRMSAGAAHGDRRYATTLSSCIADAPSRSVFRLAAQLLGILNGDGSHAFSVQNGLRQRSPMIVGDARLQEFETMALAFHDERAAGNPWHTSRSAEVRLATGDDSALEVLRELASGGYAHAARTVARHEANRK